MALRVGPRGLRNNEFAAYKGLLRFHDCGGPLVGLLLGGPENAFELSLVRGTTNSELERTRGIRLFN